MPLVTDQCADRGFGVSEVTGQRGEGMTQDVRRHGLRHTPQLGDAVLLAAVDAVANETLTRMGAAPGSAEIIPLRAKAGR